MPTRLILVDDHALVREGLRALLEKNPDIEVVGEAGEGAAALKLVAELAPDMVVVDIGMRGMNGIEATRRIHSDYPNVKVIALSTHADKRYVLEMLAAGASGYVLKEAAAEELYHAIRAVSRKHTYLSEELAVALEHDQVWRSPAEQLAASALSGREREVLQLLAEGCSSHMIARRLNISVRTVDAHRRNVMAKLNLYTVAELTKYAVRERITY